MQNQTNKQPIGSLQAADNGAHNKLYRTIWRWHFYAGLFCIPFILTLAVSGTIYLFKPQIDNWVEKPYMNLEVLAKRSSAQQQIAAAQAALPNSSFSSYRLPKNEKEAVVITLKHKGENVLVYINPYTLDVLKQIAVNAQFIRVVREFHGELLLGNTGSVLVELAGCWAIVMIVSGLYLWWPRSAKGLAGIIYPRLTRGGRIFWRDLHAVTGIWVSFFTLFLLISGLPWALVWGSAFKELRSLGQPAAVQQSWEIRSADKVAEANIQSEPNVQSEHSEHDHHAMGGVSDSAEIRILSEHLLAQAQALNFAPPVELGLARNSEDKWQVSSQHQNRMLRADAVFDANTEQQISLRTFADKSALDQTISVGISAHEGQLFGWFNQLLSLLTTIGLTLVSITGFILWRKRKPDQVLGAPPPMQNARVTKTVWLITLGLALFLPLLAISLLVLTILEYTCIRRIPSLRNWLGMTSA